MNKFKIIIIAFACTFSLNISAQNKYLGADLSLLPSYENSSVTTYYDSLGTKITDVMGFFKDQGVNTVRVRLFVNPADDGSGVIQDLDYVTAMGKRIKDKGLNFMLDFQYSDYWADPSKQYIPRSWNTSASAIQDSLYNYTKRVLNHLVGAGATPDFIQTGNEISYGMCSMTATYNSTSKSWSKSSELYRCYTSSEANWDTFRGMLNSAVKACREVCPKAKIILHTERTGNTTMAKEIYNRLSSVDYDIIGLSYYPFWHDYLTTLKSTLTTLNTAFPTKDIMIVETAYYYQWFPNDATYKNTTGTWPATPAGQKKYVDDLINAVKDYKYVTGLFYWFPEENGNGKKTDGSSIISSWINRGLFNDNNGKALPALYELKNFLGTTSNISDVTTGNKTSDNKWYTISGARINKPTLHGIYVNNKKKVLVK